MPNLNPRLELTWIGKENRPRLEPRILLEDPSKSYHAKHRNGKKDIFDNRIIFGDNLLALKALEQEFTGKVKCIYIDPPYNTGSAFEHYDDGIEHSIWLGLMRDRLELLKKLLSKDGFIFVQIDDNEQAYLRILLDEIFGRKNFIATFVWIGRAGKGGTASQIANQHEYIHCYQKYEEAQLRKEQRIAEGGNFEDETGKYKREQLRQWGQGDRREDRPSMWYPIKAPDGIDIYPIKDDGTEGRWRIGESTFYQLYNENLIDIVKIENSWKVYRKIRDGRITESVYGTLLDNFGTSATGTSEIKKLFGAKTFETPKPEKLITHFINLATKPGDLVLDSFAGSGTTGAVAHKMGRRWIMVELGEHCHTHIIPRLKKVIDDEDSGGITQSSGWKGGGGFRYYRIAPSLLQKDKWGNWIINKEYNPEMLAAAVCKLEGFTYEPSDTIYWMHGKSTESDFIYVTTVHLSHEQLSILSDEVGNGRTLLIMCTAFRSRAGGFPNLTIKKIPNAVLAKCEWGQDDYSLQIENLPMAKKPGIIQKDLFEEEENE